MENNLYKPDKKTIKDLSIKYPDRLPIFVTRGKGSLLPELQRKKFLAPKELTLGNFLYIIRKNIKLEPSKALFIFINDSILPNTAECMSILFDKYNIDGVLYCTYLEENTFG